MFVQRRQRTQTRFRRPPQEPPRWLMPAVIALVIIMGAIEYWRRMNQG
jgi:hypothetical protein